MVHLEQGILGLVLELVLLLGLEVELDSHQEQEFLGLVLPRGLQALVLELEPEVVWDLQQVELEFLGLELVLSQGSQDLVLQLELEVGLDLQQGELGLLERDHLQGLELDSLVVQLEEPWALLLLLEP